MATDAGEIQVTLTTLAADFKKGLDEAKGKIDDFSKKNDSFFSANKLALAAAGAAVLKFAKDSISAYGESEVAIAKLEQALANQGLAVQENTQHLTALATSLQNLTGYSDEAIISAQALLTTFGVQGQQLDELTRLSLDFAAAQGVDLTTAAQLLGKAAAGNTTALSRYGIIIDENIPKSEKLAAIQQQLTARFGGTAQKVAATFAGQIQIMGQSFSDLQEEIGRLLAGGGNGIVTWITSFIQKTTESIAAINAVASQFQSFGAFLKTFAVSILGTVVLMFLNLIQKMYELVAQLPIVGKAYAFLGAQIGQTKQMVEDSIVAFQAEQIQAAQTAGVMQAQEVAKGDAVQARVTREVALIDGLSTYTKDMMALEMEARRKAAEEQVQMQKDWQDLFTTSNKEIHDIAIQTTDQIFNNFGDGMADMVLEQKKFSDVVKKIWEDLARSVIKLIAQMIAKWMALMALKGFGSAIGGPLGGSIASFAGAGLGGAAEGGFVGEPSVITGMRSGKSMMVGEAGPEEIVPVGRNGYFSGGGGGGSGGGAVTINISGQFIQGDEASWSRLMREKIVPEIRRFTMSTPVGPFNRRRGVS